MYRPCQKPKTKKHKTNKQNKPNFCWVPGNLFWFWLVAFFLVSWLALHKKALQKAIQSEAKSQQIKTKTTITTNTQQAKAFARSPGLPTSLVVTLFVFFVYWHLAVGVVSILRSFTICNIPVISVLYYLYYYCAVIAVIIMAVYWQCSY